MTFLITSNSSLSSDVAAYNASMYGTDDRLPTAPMASLEPASFLAAAWTSAVEMLEMISGYLSTDITSPDTRACQKMKSIRSCSKYINLIS